MIQLTQKGKEVYKWKDDYCISNSTSDGNIKVFIHWEEIVHYPMFDMKEMGQNGNKTSEIGSRTEHKSKTICNSVVELKALVDLGLVEIK